MPPRSYQIGGCRFINTSVLLPSDGCWDLMNWRRSFSLGVKQLWTADIARVHSQINSYLLMQISVYLLAGKSFIEMVHVLLICLLLLISKECSFRSSHLKKMRKIVKLGTLVVLLLVPLCCVKVRFARCSTPNTCVWSKEQDSQGRVQKNVAWSLSHTTKTSENPANQP